MTYIIMTSLTFRKVHFWYLYFAVSPNNPLYLA
uniref:Uncharacterized protein n=1 Tax=Arundo donax TaxID=35708 RepID=A0A0A9A184_ARUDO